MRDRQRPRILFGPSSLFSALGELFPFAPLSRLCLSAPSPIVLTFKIVFAGSALGSMHGPGVTDSAFLQ